MKSVLASTPAGARAGSSAPPPGERGAALARWLRRAVIVSIRGYQRAISPLLGPACRFVPSCSEYTRQAVARHGVWRGLRLGVGRLARCHPFHPGGWDPVP